MIPGLGRSPGEVNGNTLQYSCLENSTEKGAWQAAVHVVAKSWTQLSDYHTPIHTVQCKQLLRVSGSPDAGGVWQKMDTCILREINLKYSLEGLAEAEAPTL